MSQNQFSAVSIVIPWDKVLGLLKNVNKKLVSELVILVCGREEKTKKGFR